MGISVTPALGLDTIYIPKRINSNASVQHPATLKGKLGQQVKQEYQARRDAAIYFVRGQSKKEWLLSKLPYHPQLYRTRTRVDVVLAQPLEFGPATMQGDLSKGLGQLQPAQELADVRLLTTVTSAEAHNGEPLSGILTKPVFGSDHTLLLPVGTTFTGKVTLSQRARWFHRSGKLRFEFDHVDLPVSAGLTQRSNQPNEQFIQGQLAAIETNPAAVHVDSEGTAKATEPKTRFIRPIIAGLVAAHSADDDRDRSPSIGGAGNSTSIRIFPDEHWAAFQGLGFWEQPLLSAPGELVRPSAIAAWRGQFTQTCSHAAKRLYSIRTLPWGFGLARTLGTSESRLRLFNDEVHGCGSETRAGDVSCSRQTPRAAGQSA